jgi:hypothetical protein
VIPLKIIVLSMVGSTIVGVVLPDFETTPPPPPPPPPLQEVRIMILKRKHSGFIKAPISRYSS